MSQTEHIIQRLRLPFAEDVSSLYVRWNKGAAVHYDAKQGYIFMNKGDCLSFNTYFNSFYPQHYREYTNVDSLSYLLSLEGDFRVKLFCERYIGEKEELSSQEYQECLTDRQVLLDIPKSFFAGRIYLELECLSEGGIFKGGALITERLPEQDVRLAIVICTYRKEEYVRQNAERLLGDTELKKKEWNLFVVDNAKTLSPWEDERIQLIPNKNVGGSGGFARGMLAAQESDCTHILCMDDDIAFDSEVICRLINFYSYSKKDCAVSGSMLDGSRKCMLHEAGSTYAMNAHPGRFGFFNKALKYNTDLSCSNNLNMLLFEEHIDFGAFWFFAFPYNLLKEVGYMPPFFIRMDDTDFGLRITSKTDTKIIAPPGLAVWHDSFDGKHYTWLEYYNLRNSLIIHILYQNPRFVRGVLPIFLKHFLRALYAFDYGRARMVVRALRDYLQGPDFFKDTDPEALHTRILAESRGTNKMPVPRQCSQVSCAVVRDTVRHGLLANLFQLLILNGHLLPNFLLKDEDIFYNLEPTNQGWLLFRHRKCNMVDPQNDVTLRTMDRKTAMSLTAAFVKTALRGCVRWHRVQRQWRKEMPKMRTEEFWRSYLGMM